MGATVDDNGITWTAVLWNTDNLGEIHGYVGNGSFSFTQLGNYGFANAVGMTIRGNSIPIIFKDTTFEFDLANSLKCGIIVYNSPLVIFDNCTFIARSCDGSAISTLLETATQ